VDISVALTDEVPAAAFGDGTGMLALARTSGGCLQGAAAVGERGKPAQQVGAEAAAQLLEDIAAGGCVDRWWVAC
jgi:RNA 3'-terminal phosphate cyclase (ATP)